MYGSMLLIAQMYELTVPTTIIGLLSAVIFAVLTGCGWLGMRMLNKDGVLEQYAKALMANAAAVDRVAGLVAAHDAHQRQHHQACEKAGVGIQRLHAAALEACDQMEEIGREHEIELGSRVSRVRDALTKTI